MCRFDVIVYGIVTETQHGYIRHFITFAQQQHSYSWHERKLLVLTLYENEQFSLNMSNALLVHIPLSVQEYIYHYYISNYYWI